MPGPARRPDQAQRRPTARNNIYNTDAVGQAVHLTPRAGFRGRTTHEITSTVEAGTFTTPLLQPGQKFVIRARVVTSASAVKGSLFSRLFTFSSLGNDATQDAVRLNVKRR